MKTAAAVLAVKVLPEKKMPPVTEDPPKKPGKPLVDLLAWRSPMGNPRLLVAHKPELDPNNPNHLVSVLVGNNRNFMRGMKLKARHREGIIYDLEGPLPRGRGSW